MKRISCLGEVIIPRVGSMENCYEENKELAILRSAVENTNEAFVTIDSGHRVVFFNKAAEKVFGCKRDEVVGNDLNVIMSPDCSKGHSQAVKNYLKTRVPNRIGHETEMVAIRKNGETFPANISFSVSEVENDLYFTGIVTDLTETKKLQEKIIRSEKLAALGQVVAEISHEIKNPLMMIGGFAKQLAKRSLDEKSNEKLNIIAAEVARLERLISEMREFYRPVDLRFETINLTDLIREVMDLVKPDCEKKGIVMHFDEDSDFFVDADRDKLKQVLLNLVKNAIEAMETDGRLGVETRKRDGKIAISISDSGGGIPKRDEEKIYSPFFSTKQNGTGLGLSVSKTIIEAHGGCALTMESDEGKGTTFTIIMPNSGKGSHNQ